MQVKSHKKYKENKKIIKKLYQKKVEFRETDNDNVYSFQDKKIIDIMTQSFLLSRVWG